MSIGPKYKATAVALSLLQLATATVLPRSSSQESVADKCNNFKADGITNLTLVASKHYAANALVNITGLLQNIDTKTLPAFCRMELLIETDSSAGSFANTELWLPDDFNERFLSIGNGGWAGGVAYGDLGFLAVKNGFAGMSSNCGHNSSSTDASWALNDPAAIIDFTGRALHLSTVASKALIKAYYGNLPKKNYYSGCSTGGRQGLKAAQSYPDDYDGIIAGAPANWWTHLLPWEAHVTQYVRPVNSSKWISTALWSTIHTEVLKQCDKAIDGVADGVLQDPRLCQFRPEAIACRKGATNTTACLNPDQIFALKHIFADYYETNQTFIFSRIEPGTELANPTGLFGATEFAIPEGLYQYLVYNTTTPFNTSTQTYQNIEDADKLDPGNINAINPDITEFTNRGGKLIQYHGFADQLIAPGNSIYYYNTVDEFLKTSTNITTDDVYRFFPVPGMHHCSGGEGATAFGAANQAESGYPSTKYDKSTDVMAAMVAWIEKGEAPEQIIAAKYNNNNATQGVQFTRPLCKFPGTAKYVGGDNTKASSWKCTYPAPF